jgi:hypothetical protein
MADIALVTANRVHIVESIMQITVVAGAPITAGAPVRLIPTSTGAGYGTPAAGDSAATARAIGIATRSVVAGDAVTLLRLGVLDGYVLDALNYDAPLYASDTDGRLGDVAGTSPQICGRVIPGNAVSVGVAPDKLLHVNLI